MSKINIRKGDTVKVIAGKSKGIEGKVIQVLREEGRVIVEGANLVKKHTKTIDQGGRAGKTGGAITERAEMIHARLLDAARSITVPLLVVRGSLSDVVDAAAVAELVREVPGARSFDVRGAGHMVAGDENDAFTGAVLDFLGGLP